VAQPGSPSLPAESQTLPVPPHILARFEARKARAQEIRTKASELLIQEWHGEMDEEGLVSSMPKEIAPRAQEKNERGAGRPNSLEGGVMQPSTPSAELPTVPTTQRRRGVEAHRLGRKDEPVGQQATEAEVDQPTQTTYGQVRPGAAFLGADSLSFIVASGQQQY